MSFGAYEGHLKKAVRELKYRDRTELAAPLGRLMTRLLPQILLGKHTTAGGLGGTALLVPIPLHPLRLAERGYNQSALIARALGSAAGLQVHYDALFRVEHTKQQATLEAKDRRENLSSSFRASKAAARSKRPVMLVDDVVTTGATLLSAAGELHRAGVSVIGCLTVCCTKKRSP